MGEASKTSTFDKGRTFRTDSALYVGVVPPDSPDGLRASVVLALRDEIAQPAKPDGFYSTEPDRAVLRCLRGELLQAYVAHDPRYHQQQLQMLVAYLACGWASKASRQAQVEERTARRWVADFFDFCSDELWRQDRERRERTILAEVEQVEQHRAGDLAAYQAVAASFEVQCQQMCGRQARGGSGGEGQGCPPCPRRWIGS